MTSLDQGIARIAHFRAKYPQTTWGDPICYSDECRCPPDYHLAASALISDSGPFGLRRNKAGAFVFPRGGSPKYTGTVTKRTLENIAACAAVGLHFWSENKAVGMLWGVDDDQRAHRVRINRPHQTSSHYCDRNYRILPFSDAPEVLLTDERQCVHAVKGEARWAVANTMSVLRDQLALEIGGQFDTEAPEEPMARRPKMGEPGFLHAHERRTLAAARERSLSEREERYAEEDAAIEDRVRAELGADPLPGRPALPGFMSNSQAVALIKHDPGYLGDITDQALLNVLDDQSLREHHPVVRREMTSRGLTERKRA